MTTNIAHRDDQVGADEPQRPPGALDDLRRTARRGLSGRVGLANRYLVAGCASAVGVEALADPSVTATTAAAVVVTGVCAAGHARWLRRTGRLPGYATDPLARVRDDARRAGGGAFIGLDASDAHAGVVHAPAETAVLVLGPPRRGKSSGVVIPSVLMAPGAVVSTSTKPDVLSATAAARSRFGHVWIFDPTGSVDLRSLPGGVRQLRWSPLDSAREWPSARRLAAAMVGASPAAAGVRGESHWTSRAGALLGPMLYAAATAGLEVRDVVSWVLAGDIDLPRLILDQAANPTDGARSDPDAGLALEVLAGVQQAADQERQSIWSAASDVIDVYTTHAALTAASNANWSAERFVESSDTIYIAASAEHQKAVAPLVVALVEAIRDAQYARHRAATLHRESHGAPVTLALDEVANVAPIASLPALVSEAGGQGLHVLAAVQDLSQVRGRWGVEVADGFLSLFQHVVVLGGIRDTRTLDAVSKICGDTDVVTKTTNRSWHRATFKPWEWGTTTIATGTTTQRRPRMDPGDVYALPSGTGLHLHGSAWRPIRLAPHYAHPRWTRTLADAGTVIHDHGTTVDAVGDDRVVDVDSGELRTTGTTLPTAVSGGNGGHRPDHHRSHDTAERSRPMRRPPHGLETGPRRPHDGRRASRRGRGAER